MKLRCTKCSVKEATARFTVDKDTAYCLECAEILGLGKSREATKMEQGIPRSSIVEQPEEDAKETI